jgi:Fe-Mn family superoxide dismutase
MCKFKRSKLKMFDAVHKNEKMPFSLPSLPYKMDALEPFISEKTFGFHYGKHHQAYVTNLNNLVKDTEFASLTLSEIISKTHSDADKSGIFNNAAQVWNHSFFWHSMKPQGGGEPIGNLQIQINKDFGSFENFKEEFKKAGATQFGSGWAWLVWENDKLKIVKTANAHLPAVNGQVPILTVDVWEHAYYLDYQNRRPDYLSIFLENLANWEFAENNFNNR